MTTPFHLIQINESRAEAVDTACIAAAGAAVVENKQAWVDFDGDTFSVDAALIAEGLGIGSTMVQALMREQKITSRCERGIRRDVGRYRLTFWHQDRRLQLVVDRQGEVLQRTVATEPSRDSQRLDEAL
jgi:hypothetical protein